MCDHKTIAETNNFIVLDKYTKIEQQGGGYQTEADLERELIQDLVNQGYDYLPKITTEKMLANVREQLQTLNKMQFLEGEWLRFVEQFLDKPSDNIIDKTWIVNTFLYNFYSVIFVRRYSTGVMYSKVL